MRSISFKVNVLRGGVAYTELKYAQPPTVYMDYAANIKMSLRGTFLHNDKVDYINDELAPVMIVDGTEYPLGVYCIVTNTQRYTPAYAAYEDIEAYDRGMRLSWSKLEHRDYWPAGTPYDVVISHYLTSAGIKNIAYIPSSHTLQSDREDWDIGTEYLTIINTLLSEINYQNLWFDISGNAQVKPYIAPSASIIDHHYSADAQIKTLRPECTKEIDLYAQPNVFIAILENPEYETPMVKTAVNDTPASKLSTVSRGIRIPAVYKVSNIASEEELQTYVNNIRDESMQMSEYASIETVVTPNHNVGDIVALNHPSISGLFREVEWSITMAAGQYMAHKLQRMVIL